MRAKAHESRTIRGLRIARRCGSAAAFTRYARVRGTKDGETRVHARTRTAEKRAVHFHDPERRVSLSLSLSLSLYRRSRASRARA